ncbi:hypothetical protein ACQ4PT_049985 [Festuca glaucescens]
MGIAGVAVLLLATAFIGVTADTNSDDVDVSAYSVTALKTLYTTLNSPSQLTNWASQNGDPCGQSWLGITCSNSRVITIKLPGMGLRGTLGHNMNILTTLVELSCSDTSNNNLGGSDIPYNLPPNLETLNLEKNNFTGTLPYSISHMATLKFLDLSDNTFSGTLPESFSSLKTLTTLYLQNNRFTGTIGVLSDLPLTDLNVANNQFSGWIPEKLKSIGNLHNNNPPSGSNGGNVGSSDGGKRKVGGGAVAGIVISLVVLGAMVAFFFIKRRYMRPLAPLASGKFKLLSPMNIVSPAGKEGLQRTVSMNLKPPSKIDLHRSLYENDRLNKSVATKATNLSSIRATVYTVADLQVATESFSADSLIGEGPFGRVYRGQFSDQKVLAVKKINFSALPSNPSDFFIELVANISKLNHPNLCELDGYCSEHGQCLLAYDFYRNGSLHYLLHLSDGYDKPLSWNSHVKIALGSARALEYLHETCLPSVIHKNFKSANILLDDELNPHLSDCGFADLIPNHELQESDDNSGYRAPEHILLYELVSSLQWSQQPLVRWATPQLHDIDALDQMVDPAMEGLYPAKSLSRFADAIALCVQPEPEFRPPMSEVVQSLVRLVQRSGVLRGGSDSLRHEDHSNYKF